MLENDTHNVIEKLFPDPFQKVKIEYISGWKVKVLYGLFLLSAKLLTIFHYLIGVIYSWRSQRMPPFFDQPPTLPSAKRKIDLLFQNNRIHSHVTNSRPPTPFRLDVVNVCSHHGLLNTFVFSRPWFPYKAFSKTLITKNLK